jgi:hypothetical protein
MIALSITPGAYKALKVMLPATDSATPGADGLVRVWLDRGFVGRLKALRKPGEGYSETIIRVAKV